MSLLDSTRERLTCLAEELSEAQQMICKALRHGLDSTHHDYGYMPNDTLIAKELGDALAWIDVLCNKNELPQWAIDIARQKKAEKIRRGTHFHHQHDVHVEEDRP